VDRHCYSYGSYLYGFMVQQCLAAIAAQLIHVMSIVVVGPLILVCAALSWHCVERPVLAWHGGGGPDRSVTRWRFSERATSGR
jgi:peptidoglycan/LPS O-acetylase OafA/YrhL